MPEPAKVLYHGVEFVPVKHQDALAIRRGVNRVLLQGLRLRALVCGLVIGGPIKSSGE